MHLEHAWTTETYASAGVAVMRAQAVRPGGGGRAAQQRSRDHGALDLRRALVDLGDLGVAVEALGGEARRVPVAAQALDRLAGPPPCHAGGEQLGLRALD